MASPASDDRTARLDAWLALTGQVPTTGATVELPLLSGSMAPAIPVGARLRIAVAPGAPVAAGDVAVFADGERLVAHRVVLVLRIGNTGRLLEMGDANRHGRWRHPREVRGRVVGFVAADGNEHPDPAAPRAATRGLRRLLRHLLDRHTTEGES